MAETEKFIVEIEKAKEGEDGKPSIGPVYRNVLAKDGFIPLPQELDCCWDIFCQSVKKIPNNPMLGEREMVRGKAGSYVWSTYQEVYDLVLKIGASICSSGAMQACNAYGLYCVPLYDTLGAVEYIIGHAEISFVFVDETKISEVLKTFPSTETCLKTIVSFGKISLQQKKEAGNFGIKMHSWNDFCFW